MACGSTLSLKRSLEFDPVHESCERSVKRRCMPMTLSAAVPPTKQHQVTQSPFTPVSSKVTSEQIAAHISAHMKLMQRRKLLMSESRVSESSEFQHPCSSNHFDDVASSSSSYSAANNCCKDQPLLTLKQAGLVCERMIREKEEKLKEEYEKVLSTKLVEQYEAFLKFNHDELYRHFGETASSYVS